MRMMNFPRFPLNDPRHRRRASSFVLALIVHLLVIGVLLNQAPNIRKKPSETPTTFALLPEPKGTHSKATVTPREELVSTADPQQTEVAPAQKIASEAPSKPVLPWIPLSEEQFSATDISRLPKRESGAAMASAGQGSGAVYGPGEGPGGEQLYEAEWYRHPNDAELSAYLPKSGPIKGWGLVACKTVDHFRVENCQALGESPAGSGLARAVRLAAWQFQILPPRIGGRPQIGAWVRIRIDYNQTLVERN